jgi:hypothetical protein
MIRIIATALYTNLIKDRLLNIFFVFVGFEGSLVLT